jgi:hypothetical protein
VHDNQLGVIPKDGTATVVAGVPHFQMEDGVGALDRHDGRVQRFPKAISEVPIHPKLGIKVWGGVYHIRW